MIKIVSGHEANMVVNIVADAGKDGIKISDAVTAAAYLLDVTPADARYIVRSVLDKGRIKTDSQFKLHLP